MRKSILSALAFALAASGFAQSSPYEQKIDALLAKMSLKEKVGQMAQIDIGTFAKRLRPDSKFWEPMAEPHTLSQDSIQKYLIDYAIGSMFNVGDHGYTPQEWYVFAKQIQDAATKKTTAGVPVLYGIDAIHGAALTVGATVFPQQIGMASTWDTALAKRAAQITAYEMRASNNQLDFAPGLDMGKHPVWSRFDETWGEDVLLGRAFSKQVVDGLEGDNNNLSDPTKVTTNLKHFIGYSFPMSGKDRTPSWIPERYLREYFIRQFEDCIKAGAHTIILNSSEINGVPMHADTHWIQDVLRGELGFKGVILSDWRDVEKLHYVHHVAASYKDAVKMAIDAGVDMNMVPYDNRFMDLLIELVKEGKVSEERINQSVRRILQLKFELGLFEKPVSNPADYPKFACAEYQQTAKQAAQQSLILLKNANNVLPLAKTAKVLVTGPAANTMCALNGGWTYSWQGQLSDKYAANESTILEAIQAKIGKKQVSYVKGADFNAVLSIDSIKKAAADVDYIVLCLGETPYAETPGFIEDLYMSDAQTQLAAAVAQTGKPVVLLLSEGRPRIISKFEASMQAVLLGMLPGNKGGEAFADVLFGDYNPSGKLPFSYPRYPNDLIPYDHKYTDGVDHVWGYSQGYNPQYAFAYGLSYTQFAYSDLKIDKTTLSANESLHVSITVRNVGQRAGREIVPVFVRDLVASITPPVRRLRAFKLVDLQPGEQKTLTFDIPVSELKFVGIQNTWIVEPGDFTLMVDKLQASFEVK